ncbi:MAG: type II toxin-antitoxin system VapC family toxin [Deltaproteobacteria bacterium]|nr:type II toxin-antitoxin system VapC family toxin [Deltaproteobacteria bacterium]
MTLHYLVDTDWVIHYLKGRDPFVERLQALGGQSLAISVITLGELYEGVYGAAEPDKRAQGLKDFLQGVTILGLDEETCRIFGKERRRLRRAGNLPGDMDLFIGATALRHNLIVLTNNRHHFERIEGLHLESLPSSS